MVPAQVRRIHKRIVQEFFSYTKISKWMIFYYVYYCRLCKWHIIIG